MAESIYNLVPVEIENPAKPKMYRSMHDPKTPVTGSTFGIRGTTQSLGAGCIKKKDTATFGKPPRTQIPDPRTYLKGGDKLSRVPARVEVDEFHYQGERKELVPKRGDRPVMGLKTTKNFITANAVEAILQVPKIKVTEEPDYLKKTDYGQPPGYLEQVKEEIRRENEMIDAYVKEQMGYCHDDNDEPTEQLADDERIALIKALKTKWDAVNAKYQKMTHNVNLDTVGKVKRKEAMESELKALEADIGKLEKPQPIYIKRDC
ncbi:hypothetical protein CTAYLR_006895 [Chrysophaeum taylorii]|uniref:Enkurin domain-containing protein n=1 Tax=Chrysophaeum taylorii TaxID=2483200 RepID=A0AAD7UGK0_9STRA|nr:hypothetical protein CTAYLR_006895 [Chrysophaeum taylorii]